MNRLQRTETEPETRVGNCCGCNQCPITLFKVPGMFRYRCAVCFETECGYRHYLSNPKQTVISAHEAFKRRVQSATDKARRQHAVCVVETYRQTYDRMKRELLKL